MPGVQARLPVERRLLVAGDARDRHAAVAGQRVVRDARRTRPSTAGSRGSARSGHAEQLEQLVRPGARPQVVEQRARGVRRVGRVLAGELPGEPAVDRPEDRAPVARPLGEPVDVLAAATRSSCPRSTGRARGPVRSRTSGSCPCARSSSQRAAVRRSCQTIARCSGSPVAGSQTQTVSRWFVMPIAASPPSGTPASASASSASARVTSQISCGSCSTQPGCGKCCCDLAVGAADELGLVVEHEAGAARGALVDREDHGARSLPAPAAGTSTGCRKTGPNVRPSVAGRPPPLPHHAGHEIEATDERPAPHVSSCDAVSSVVRSRGSGPRRG